jgi:parallel beta-helix repeat protein
MLKIKKVILVISISLVLSLISISGCIEETQPVEVKNSIYVDDDGGADYTKIQDAIDHVADGGTVFVLNGTYNETVVINKSINLIGASKDKTIINYEIYSDRNINIVLIEADNCTIKEFKIKGAGTSSKLTGINIKASNSTISNNSLLHIYNGVTIDKDSKNNTISWNNISDARYGIDTYSSENNNILENNISSCRLYGIYLFDSYNNIVSRNMVSENRYGIRAKNSKNNKIFENVVVNNKNGMLICCGAENNVIYFNIFKQNSIINAEDESNNQWDNGSVGNYWDDYIEKYPDAIQIDGIWDTPYNITGTLFWDNIDRYPIVNPMDI